MADQSPGDVRHALRNRLNTIAVNAELIKLLTRQENTTDKIMQSVERILNECKSSGDLLDNNE